MPARPAGTYTAQATVISAVPVNKVYLPPCTAAPPVSVALASDTRCSNAARFMAMRFSLLRLSQEQTIDIAESRVPANLQVDIADESLPPDFIGGTALEQLSEGKSAYWCAVFLIVRNLDRLVVGSCCFKDEPRNERVEIGYGVSPGYRRQGAATEAVLALLKLACAGGAKEVLAEVSAENVASTSLMRTLGFVSSGTRVDKDNETVAQWVAKVDA